jgi:hypothetical protein
MGFFFPERSHQGAGILPFFWFSDKISGSLAASTSNALIANAMVGYFRIAI